MPYTKRSFTLIEVVIALLLASGACLFLLNFESTLLLRSRESVKKLEVEHVKQTAITLLFENLYTNQIPWKALIEGKVFSVEIPDSFWIAQWHFTPLCLPEMVDPDHVKVLATLSLCNNQKEEIVNNTPSFRLFLKREVADAPK